MKMIISSDEELKKMFDELKISLLENQEKLKPTLASSVGWRDTNKICEDTGLSRATLILYKEREWLKPNEDFYQLGRKYFWRVESIRSLLSGQKELPEGEEGWD